MAKMAISGVGVRELPEAHTFDFITSEGEGLVCLNNHIPSGSASSALNHCTNRCTSSEEGEGLTGIMSGMSFFMLGMSGIIIYYHVGYHVKLLPGKFAQADSKRSRQ